MILLFMAVNCWVGVPIALSQNLTDHWVEKAAAPLIEKRVADGLSIGYIEGEHYGHRPLGKLEPSREKCQQLDASMSSARSARSSPALLLADAVVRGEIDLNAAAEVANPAGIRLPSRDGRVDQVD